MVQSILPEIIFVDKPKGISSFDVIRKLRKKYGHVKMGFAGTLDPLASGLMVIGFGQNTKKLRYFSKMKKTYEADIYIGKRTDTGDWEGKVIEEKNVQSLDFDTISHVIRTLRGTLRLPIPKYSATKVSGKRMYEIARAGKELNVVPLQDMDIYDVTLLEHTAQEYFHVIRLRIEVDQGTYIRSIAEEIGRRLGFPAVVKDLRRTKIGTYDLTNVVSFE